MHIGDVGTTPRGMANFAVAEGPNGEGIRPTPYSTDFAVDPFTYGIPNNGAF